MTLSDEAKLFAVRAKLLEAERTIYEANKIIANIGHSNNNVGGDTNINEPGIDGLYPGQLPNLDDNSKDDC